MPFTITGRDQPGTINERLYIIFPGTRHYKPRQLANGEGKLAPAWREAEQERKVASYRIQVQIHQTAAGLMPRCRNKHLTQPVRLTELSVCVQNSSNSIFIKENKVKQMAYYSGDPSAGVFRNLSGSSSVKTKEHSP